MYYIISCFFYMLLYSHHLQGKIKIFAARLKVDIHIVGRLYIKLNYTSLALSFIKSARRWAAKRGPSISIDASRRKWRQRACFYSHPRSNWIYRANIDACLQRSTYRTQPLRARLDYSFIDFVWNSFRRWIMVTQMSNIALTKPEAVRSVCRTFEFHSVLSILFDFLQISSVHAIQKILEVGVPRSPEGGGTERGVYPSTLEWSLLVAFLFVIFTDHFRNSDDGFVSPGAKDKTSMGADKIARKGKLNPNSPTSCWPCFKK